ncbi:phenylalanyl-tRNA synthetase subunit beta [Candidatus Acidianus copahuensis]|uniref:Phenylalanine--tRNA ligase beta subunit n=1 Tax=Candidatus Acidianus copahuensis TaxID=1160895 RepID=A0A031LK49_9CREN|nr:phenylalanine--tRNA ligase subunit beta [Candidatus Acidianus copahuensis]EZQ03183.1 phenylalanyl-tRNA synthetase subunit beta [Candidatus Acidianus copahuensis]
MVTIVVKESKILEKVKLTEKELEEVLFNLKSETEKIGEDELSIEINADRLDMLSSDGISRAVKGFLGVELGEPNYQVIDTDYKLVVEKVSQRPYALAAVVYDVNLDDDFIKELIQFQEKLHDTIGRKRKKVAIGIHDLGKIREKEIHYRLASLNESFVPLNQRVLMEISDVLTHTDQGKLYANISLFNGTVPAIAEASGDILSLPPIINSDRTKIDNNTSKLFIDVTGTNFDAVAETLDIIVSNLAEGGSKIGRVNVVSDYSNFSPIMRHNRLEFNSMDINRRLGFSLTSEDIVHYLRKSRMEAEAIVDKVAVIVPQYRVDIMTYTDVAEDVGMMYGYQKISLKKPGLSEMGKLNPMTKLERNFRELVIGAGFQEIFSLVLIRGSLLQGNYVSIVNSISEEYNAVRNSLIWTSLKFLEKNQFARFPIKIFEVGEVVVRDESTDTGYRNENRSSLAIMDSKVKYEDLQSVLHQVIKGLTGKYPIYSPITMEFLIGGRASRLLLNNQCLGIIGEVHPNTLVKYGIKYPVVIAEIYLEKITEVM